MAGQGQENRQGYQPPVYPGPQGQQPGPFYGYPQARPDAGPIYLMYPPMQAQAPEKQKGSRLRTFALITGSTVTVAAIGLGALYAGVKIVNSENGDNGNGAGGNEPLSPAEQQRIRESFPTTTAEAATAMGVDPRYVFKEGTKWTAEFFPLKDGVSYDPEKGYHVNGEGEQLTTAQDIFRFQNPDGSWVTPEWQTVRNDSMGVLFARTGGLGGDQANTSRFIGTGGSAGMIEQASLLPPTEACIGDTFTDSWRQAVSEYVTNSDTWRSKPANERVTTEWFNPITNQLQAIDGRMIAALAEAGDISKSVIETLPAGYPLTPEQVVSYTGGTTKPENWSFNTQNGVWTWEGFNLKPGVSYNAETGLLYKNGQIIENPTDYATGAYNYDAWESATGLWKTSFEMSELPGTYTFVRTGGGSAENPNSSWYGYGQTVTGGTFEQAALIPVPPQTGCTSYEIVDAKMTADAERQAQNADVKQVFISTPSEYRKVK